MNRTGNALPFYWKALIWVTWYEKNYEELGLVTHQVTSFNEVLLEEFCSKGEKENFKSVL